MQIQTPSQGLQAQGEGLGRLLWVYLRLLSTRQAINRIIRGAGGAPDESAGLEERIGQLQSRLQEPLTEDLRKSLTGQIEISAAATGKAARGKRKAGFPGCRAYPDPGTGGTCPRTGGPVRGSGNAFAENRSVTTTLGSTTQWISDQQKIYGAVEDLMSEPPPIQLTVDE